ncbi:GTP-binding protein [Geosmithia morbida]|uniref:GTP-binding protein n=1 Tax=Geosmithia morbida TaxID=1094350 RepID=A0A9P4YS21_9HYPO|nr:GTP-binding protein [Geosmithia morbida]KAF4122076.1 GTP-binding protein [Geosmithia morbida]
MSLFSPARPLLQRANILSSSSRLRHLSTGTGGDPISPDDDGNSTLRKSKKKGSRGNPITESLAPLDTIRIVGSVSASADASKTAAAAPPKETKEERRAASAADRFFRRGYDFLYSAEGLPTHRPNAATPEVVVLGASNAGKSSFLNSLLGRSDAARVSSRPGHTITMNAFGVGRRGSEDNGSNKNGSGNVNSRGGGNGGGGGVGGGADRHSGHGLILVDTPGYGHASRKGWGDSICRYVERRTMLRGAVVLVPAQKGLHAMDRWVLRMLAERNKRVLVVLTKADMAGRDWWGGCRDLAADVRAEMRRLEARLDNGWREGDGWITTVYATAAGWPRRRSVGQAPGMSGARVAILEHLAGFALQEKVETKPSDVSYGGEIVSWDDILAQTSSSDK